MSKCYEQVNTSLYDIKRGNQFAALAATCDIILDPKSCPAHLNQKVQLLVTFSRATLN